MTGRLLTAREVADRLRLKSPETVLKWIREGKLPAIQLPSGAIRIDEDDFEAKMREWATPASGGASHPSDAARDGRYSGVGSVVLATTPPRAAAEHQEDR